MCNLEKCKECEGTGLVYDAGGHEDICKVCDGNGTIETEEGREERLRDCKPHNIDEYLDQHPMAEFKEDE